MGMVLRQSNPTSMAAKSQDHQSYEGEQDQGENGQNAQAD
jgi:hypothetical protein